MLITLFALVICAILFAYYVYKNTKARPKNFPPGPPRLPIWGSYWYILKEHYFHPHLAFESLAKKYKTDLLGVFLGDLPCIVAVSSDICREVLTKEEFNGRTDTIIARTRSLGELKGILSVDGPFWKDQKRFSLRNLRDFGFGRRSQVMEDFVANEVKYLINTLNSTEPSDDIKDICRGKGEFLLPDVFYGSLLNSALLVLASTKVDNYYELRELARAALRFQRSGDGTGGAITITPWLRYIAPDFFGFTPAIEDIGYILKFCRQLIDEHIATFSPDHYRDFIDVYIGEKRDENGEMDYNQLLLTVLDYLGPTAISIGNTLSLFFTHLINNPHVQVKIQDEIDSVVGKSRLPNLDDRQFMPYLEASIRETSRISPINALGVPRRCMEDTYFHDYFIPKDTIILSCVWSAHRDPAIWTDPDKFLPERFLDDSGNLTKKDSTLGFGAGKRACAGETFSRQNLFLIAAGLLQNFNFKSPNGKPIKIDLIPGGTLSLKNNWIVAESR